MTTKLRKKCNTCIVAGQVGGCLFGCDKTERVTRALDVLMRDSVSQRHPIEERLQQCPEAFQAGELLERALHSLQYGQDEISHHERWLPPAGAIVPPIV
jgi:hypothetical protein